MNRLFKVIALFASVATASFAQVLVLDDFNLGTATGSVDPSTSWSGQTTQNSTTLTVGGIAKDDSGWTYTYAAPVDLSSYHFFQITAQRDSGNVAGNLSLTFADDNGSDFTTITIATSMFNVGSLTTVEVPFSWTGAGTTIAAWNLGGGQPTPGSAAFRMTFDNMSISTASTAPVPEPSTYAAIFGVCALGLAAYRRRQVAV